MGWLSVSNKAYMKQINKILEPYFYGKLDIEQRICAEKLDAHFKSQLQVLRDATFALKGKYYADETAESAYNDGIEASLSLLDNLIKEENGKL